jgi:hypothetical protein
MRASRIAESGLKIIISPESSEALLFDPKPPRKNLLYGARQVVVNDDGKNTEYSDASRHPNMIESATQI